MHVERYIPFESETVKVVRLLEGLEGGVVDGDARLGKESVSGGGVVQVHRKFFAQTYSLRSPSGPDFLQQRLDKLAKLAQVFYQSKVHQRPVNLVPFKRGQVGRAAFIVFQSRG